MALSVCCNCGSEQVEKCAQIKTIVIFFVVVGFSISWRFQKVLKWQQIRDFVRLSGGKFEAVEMIIKFRLCLRNSTFVERYHQTKTKLDDSTMLLTRNSWNNIFSTNCRGIQRLNLNFETFAGSFCWKLLSRKKFETFNWFATVSVIVLTLILVFVSNSLLRDTLELRLIHGHLRRKKNEYNSIWSDKRRLVSCKPHRHQQFVFFLISHNYERTTMPTKLQVNDWRTQLTTPQNSFIVFKFWDSKLNFPLKSKRLTSHFFDGYRGTSQTWPTSLIDSSMIFFSWIVYYAL